MTHGSLPIGDGSAYVVGASQSAISWDPKVWRCPATAGTQTKCTPVTVSGVD
jgi:hypothetical protein